MAILASLLALPPGPAQAACLRVAAPLAAGEVPLREELAPADCPEPRPAPGFRYDPAARTVRALRELPVGTVVAAVPASLLAAVRPGQKLVVTIRVGAATLAREVTALRAARPGDRILVRAAGNEVFTVPAAEIRP
jgi:hypothetical protein